MLCWTPRNNLHRIQPPNFGGGRMSKCPSGHFSHDFSELYETYCNNSCMRVHHRMSRNSLLNQLVIIPRIYVECELSLVSNGCYPFEITPLVFGRTLSRPPFIARRWRGGGPRMNWAGAVAAPQSRSGNRLPPVVALGGIFRRLRSWISGDLGTPSALIGGKRPVRPRFPAIKEKRQTLTESHVP